MRRALPLGLMLVGLLACGDRSGTGVCTSTGEGQLRCAIDKASDCDAVRDYPYARNLFCPAAFGAARTMVAALADSLGAEAPTRGFFYYYQTVADPGAAPDDQAQTTAACLETRAPWGSREVVGAGRPLCRLIAHVTSPGPIGVRPHASANPVPGELRAYPEYFTRLYPPNLSTLLDEFRGGSAFDQRIRDLGATAREKFLADYPVFAPDALYDPADWWRDPQYHGISGGGGGGWGGEIGIEGANGDALVLLAFGGGGGGGLTSARSSARTSTRVGAGGGGGVQLADGYRLGDRVYDGLGLGGGVGSDDDGVQYSYFDYEGSGRPPRTLHEYNPAVIADYQAQLANLISLLRARMGAGDRVVLRGGGGMGAGAEYLMENGVEHTPHALSTQAGFQFRYEFEQRGVEAGPVAELDARQESAYSILGELYRRATAQAYLECGRDYSNIACLCPKTHALVVRRMAEALGDGARLPAWLRQPHCPSAAAPDA